MAFPLRMALSTQKNIEKAIRALQNGRLIILTDDRDRENEGDFVLAGEKARLREINFMASHGRGLQCVPLTRAIALRLDLPLMTEKKDKFGTAFTVSVDAAACSTGISIADRYTTLKTISHAKTLPSDLVRPGHLFPIIARDGGVLERAGHTEGTIDLLKLAGLTPVGLICEILREDGSMARETHLRKLARKYRLPLVSIREIIAYRLQHEKSHVVELAKPKLHTRFGNFYAHVFRDLETNEDYIALEKGNVRNKKNVLVRVHSGCMTGDIFGSLHCDCGPQLHAALRRITQAREGVLLYIPHHEGRGIGLAQKLQAYELQAKGQDTVEANLSLGLPEDKRDYGKGALVLRALGLSSIRILTNNPKKLVGLEAFGLSIAKQIPLMTKSNPHNERYLKTKKEKMGHLL